MPSEARYKRLVLRRRFHELRGGSSKIEAAVFVTDSPTIRAVEIAEGPRKRVTAALDAALSAAALELPWQGLWVFPAQRG